MPPKTAGASSSANPSKKKQKHSAARPQSTMGLTKLTSQQKEFFNTVTQRGLRQTKFPSIRILKALGLDQPVKFLLGRVGLEGLLQKEAPTYDRLTYEFLSTLSKDEDDSGKFITFHVNDQPFKMSYDDVRDAFGWRDVSDDAYLTTRSFNPAAFFSTITPGLQWDNNRKASSLPHPALRYITVVLNMTIFCVEASNLPSATLKALWAMTAAGKGCPDWVDIFVHRCIHLRGSEKGNIDMGGMVTLLVDWLISDGQIETDCMDWPDEVVGKKDKEPRLDREQLKTRDMLWYEDVKGQPVKYIWLYGLPGKQKPFYMALPQPRTMIHENTTVQQLYLDPDEKFRPAIEEILGQKLPQRVQENDDTDEDEDETDEEGDDNDDDEEGNDNLDDATTDEPQVGTPFATRFQRLEDQYTSLQSQVDGLEDQIGDMGLMVSAMNQYFLSQPGYINPAIAIEENRRERAAARAARRLGAHHPGGSSHL